MIKTHFYYALFGLIVRSQIELPELRLAEPDGWPAIEIELAPAMLNRSPPGVHPLPDGALLVVDEVAEYRVTHGRRIVIGPRPGAPWANVRLFLLGSAMGLLVHQRGLLPLHANAVEIDGQAVAFAGASGAGKSTLAAWFHDRGARIVADDVCVIGFADDGCPLALPGIPRFRLWREALERLGRNAGDHPRSYAGDESYDKYDVAADEEGVTNCPLPLRAIYLIERGDSVAIDRVEGLAAAEALFAHTYRGSYVERVGQQKAHWQQCVGLLDSVPIYRLRRPWGLGAMDAVNAELRASL